MSAPNTFIELAAWLQSKTSDLTHAANRAVEDGNMTHDQAMVVHAENVAMHTAKALNRALEILAERLDAKPEEKPE